MRHSFLSGIYDQLEDVFGKLDGELEEVDEDEMDEEDTAEGENSAESVPSESHSEEAKDDDGGNMALRQAIRWTTTFLGIPYMSCMHIKNAWKANANVDWMQYDTMKCAVM